MNNGVGLRDVRVTLGGVQALKGVTLSIPTGGITGVLGPSGAGKTTLLRVIVGRQAIDSGTAQVLGQAAGSPSLRQRIGYMPQTPALYYDLTVVENLRYFARMAGVKAAEVDAVLAAVDLSKQTDQLVATLSGGQRSRASLAIALLGEPELLVLDEPTVGVDPLLRQKLWEIFRHLAANGVTLLVSSHVMDEASRCDDLLLIRSGKLLARGTPEGLCGQTQTSSVEDAFLTLIRKGRR